MAARKLAAMDQHAEAKRAYPDAIVFFRLGDFYEMFGEDALLCARELELTLTSRNKGKADELPMAGVPHHAAHTYVGRLLKSGYKVAICEQMADPATVKGVVPRQVVRVLTPGTVTHSEHLDTRTNSWLCAVEVGERIGVALLELSTAELRATSFSDFASALGELGRALPREIVVSVAAAEELGALVVTLPTAAIRRDGPLSPAEIDEALGELASDATRLPNVVRGALGRVLRFARACAPGRELPIRRIATWDPTQSLVIDAVAQNHLELVESYGGRTEATLLGVLNHTATAFGSRLLRSRLLAPSIDLDLIRRRLDLVELFVDDAELRSFVARELGEVADLARIAVRIEMGEATPRDLGAVRDSLLAAGRLLDRLSQLDDARRSRLSGLTAAPDTLTDLAQLLANALVERPPALLKEGAVFRSEHDAELSELAALRKNGAELIASLERRLRDETGIPTLRIRQTRIFGWYLEVSRAQLKRVPAEWRRKQTIANAERYTVAELDDLADRLGHAEERYRDRELDLFRELSQRVKERVERLQQLTTRLGEWDVATSLAEVAHRNDYVRPVVDDSLDLEIEEGRHPVVEQLAARGRFVPNDVRLAIEGERFWIISGPNMAGKSTFLRQVAVSTILAQMGSFVPARSARIGIVDRVLSRVGASDNLAGGESTFMVEMRETAEILQKASRRSLVILDEIGRGTSTFDGLAIAWAVAEHLEQVVGCRVLFATHYHELTQLGEVGKAVANYSVGAREHAGEVIFIHRVLPGAASRSYGVAVAKLAGLPQKVITRAEKLLAIFEAGASPVSASPAPALAETKEEPRPRKPGRVPLDQLALFGPGPKARE